MAPCVAVHSIHLCEEGSSGHFTSFTLSVSKREFSRFLRNNSPILIFISKILDVHLLKKKKLCWLIRTSDSLNIIKTPRVNCLEK